MTGWLADHWLLLVVLWLGALTTGAMLLALAACRSRISTAPVVRMLLRGAEERCIAYVEGRGSSRASALSSASDAGYGSSPTMTADVVLAARCAAPIGSREGTAVLLRGMARALRDEQMAASDPVVRDSLVFLTGDVLDALDVIEFEV